MNSKISRILALCLICLLLPSTSAPVLAQGASPSSNDNAGSSYLIQPNDLLEIFVYNEPTWTRKVTVQPDGWVSVPLVQDIKAAGLTTGQLKLEIEKRLAEYKELPNVTVMLDSVQSYKIYVTGKVQKSGVVASEKPLTVLQAITLAGGFLEYAKREEISIIRNTGKQFTYFPFNYVEVISGKNQFQNRYLESGDVVVVP